MASNKPVHSIPSATGGIARLAYTRPREYLAAAQEHNLSEGGGAAFCFACYCGVVVESDGPIPRIRFVAFEKPSSFCRDIPSLSFT